MRYNFSTKRQCALEEFVSKYPNAVKSKLLPLCWVERINALGVSLDLLEAGFETTLKKTWVEAETEKVLFMQ